MGWKIGPEVPPAVEGNHPCTFLRDPQNLHSRLGTVSHPEAKVPREPIAKNKDLGADRGQCSSNPFLKTRSHALPCHQPLLSLHCLEPAALLPQPPFAAPHLSPWGPSLSHTSACTSTDMPSRKFLPHTEHTLHSLRNTPLRWSFASDGLEASSVTKPGFYSQGDSHAGVPR